MNGDTFVDAFCANISGGNKLWLNDGNGVFTESGIPLGSRRTRDAAAFDANGDTHLDIWAGNGFTSSQLDELWLGDGAGNFTLDESYESRRTYGVAAADFNGDSDIDVFAASGDGDHVVWAQGADAVAAYAASFGLSGDETLPFADPDLDGVLNFEEMAFNMNPAMADESSITNLATDTKGLPRIFVDNSGPTPKFVAETIRRIGVPEIDYRLEAGPDFPLLPATSRYLFKPEQASAPPRLAPITNEPPTNSPPPGCPRPSSAFSTAHNRITWQPPRSRGTTGP